MSVQYVLEKRDITSGPFVPPTPVFEAPWGDGQRPLTAEEQRLYEPSDIHSDSVSLIVASAVYISPIELTE